MERNSSMIIARYQVIILRGVSKYMVIHIDFKRSQPRKYAAYVNQDDPAEVLQSDIGSEVHTAPNITVLQYIHLISMLVSQKEHNNAYSGGDIGRNGLFTGNHCLLSYTSNND